MTDEDFITTYYNSDDIPNLGRVLQAWYSDMGWEPWRYDGSNITRSSYGDNDETTPVNVAQYVRAVLGFLFAIIIYFAVLCYVCDRERTVSKQEVDRSIITKVNNNNMMMMMYIIMFVQKYLWIAVSHFVSMLFISLCCREFNHTEKIPNFVKLMTLIV